MSAFIALTCEQMNRLAESSSPMTCFSSLARLGEDQIRAAIGKDSTEFARVYIHAALHFKSIPHAKEESQKLIECYRVEVDKAEQGKKAAEKAVETIKEQTRKSCEIVFQDPKKVEHLREITKQNDAKILALLKMHKQVDDQITAQEKLLDAKEKQLEKLKDSCVIL